MKGAASSAHLPPVNKVITIPTDTQMKTLTTSPPVNGLRRRAGDANGAVNRVFLLLPNGFQFIHFKMNKLCAAARGKSLDPGDRRGPWTCAFSGDVNASGIAADIEHRTIDEHSN